MTLGQSTLANVPSEVVAAHLAAKARLEEMIGEEDVDLNLATDVDACVGISPDQTHLIVTSFSCNGERFTYRTCIQQTGVWSITRTREPIVAAAQPAAVAAGAA